MGLKIQCSDLESEMGVEPTCPYIAKGENMDELMADLSQHAKKVHGYTDEQLQDPKTAAAVKAVLKQD